MPCNHHQNKYRRHGHRKRPTTTTTDMWGCLCIPFNDGRTSGVEWYVSVNGAHPPCQTTLHEILHHIAWIDHLHHYTIALCICALIQHVETLFLLSQFAHATWLTAAFCIACACPMWTQPISLHDVLSTQPHHAHVHNIMLSGRHKVNWASMSHFIIIIIVICTGTASTTWGKSS